MVSRFNRRVVLCAVLGGVISTLVVGCKEGSGDQDTRPLPAPEPPAASTGPSLRDEAAGTPKRRAGDGDPDSPSKAKRPSSAADSAVREVPAGAAPTLPATGTAATPAPSGTALLPTLPAPGAQPAAPSAACSSRCQGALQGCLSQPVDGGVPGFGNLEVCKQAFEACQTACKP